MLVDTYTTLVPPLLPLLRQEQVHHKSSFPTFSLPYDASALFSLSFGAESSAEVVFIEATMGATAGAGVVDLLIFAACNL